MNEQTDSAVPDVLSSTVLTARQIDTLRALTDRLIPPAPGVLGGADGGAFFYILRELEEGGNLASFQAHYRAFLDALDGENFTALGDAEKDELLHRIEADTTLRQYFSWIVEHAQEGYYTDPANWSGIGYRMTG